MECATVEGDAKLKTSCDEDGEEKTNGSVFLEGWLDGSERRKGESECWSRRGRSAQLPASAATVCACLIRPGTTSPNHQRRALHGQVNSHCHSIDISASSLPPYASSVNAEVGNYILESLCVHGRLGQDNDNDDQLGYYSIVTSSRFVQ
jgi:hypothetical protein